MFWGKGEGQGQGQGQGKGEGQVGLWCFFGEFDVDIGMKLG